MRYREVEILNYTNLGLSGTRIIDINLRDPISALFFRISAAIGAGARLDHVLQAISRVELVDGSDVLLSLSPRQIDGLHFFERGELGNSAVTEIPSTTVTSYTTIYFGRKLWDRELGFDPKRFNNPQLRFTFNAATVEAAATAVWLEIVAKCFDEDPPALSGFLQNREYYRYTPTAGATHYINLPTDLVLRKLIVQPAAFRSTPGQGLASARLDEDNDKRVIFDLTAGQLVYQSFQNHGWMHQDLIMTREGQAQPTLWAGSDGAVVTGLNVSAVQAVRLIGSSGCNASFTKGAPDNETIYAHGQDRIPYWMLPFSFGDKDEIADWYDVTKVGDLRLRLIDGILPYPSPFTTVILQQLRRY